MKLDEIIISGVRESFLQFGLSNLEVEKTQEKNMTYSNLPVNITIGYEGKWKGSVIVGMDERFASYIVKIMTMGMIEDFRDEMGLSALSELINMVAGSVANKLSENNTKILISPPTIIVGNEIKIFLNKVNTTSISFLSESGKIEVNAGLWESI